MKKSLMLLCFLALLALPAAAQDDEGLVDEVITYDDVVQGTITEQHFFDFWRFQGQRGEVVVIFMTGQDGLAPLIGLLDSGRNLIASSDGQLEGTRVDAEPNSEIDLEVELPESGEFIIVATRAGNADGTTTGSYILRLRRASASDTQVNPYQDVTFRCRDLLATTAATLILTELGEQTTVSVYGLDGFRPLIRLEVEGDEQFSDCTSISDQMGGDQIMLPGEDPIAFEGDPPESAARIIIEGSAFLTGTTLTVASIDGAAGRYVVVIEGFSLNPAGDTDFLTVRLGPLAAQTEMLVYMVTDSRGLDPVLSLLSAEDDDIADTVCDDAGRRGCEDVPDFTGAGIIFNDGRAITGDRFDAGLRLAPGHPDPVQLELSSRVRAGAGTYTILLIGELPSRESGDD